MTNYKPIRVFNYSRRLQHMKAGSVRSMRFQGKRIKVELDKSGRSLKVLDAPKSVLDVIKNAETLKVTKGRISPVLKTTKPRKPKPAEPPTPPAPAPTQPEPAASEPPREEAKQPEPTPPPDFTPEPVQAVSKVPGKPKTLSEAERRKAMLVPVPDKGPIPTPFIDWANIPQHCRVTGVNYMDYPHKISPKGMLPELREMFRRSRRYQDKAPVNVQIQGLKGTGKSELIKKFAEDTGLPYWQVMGQEGIRADELLGHYVLKEGTSQWIDGIIPKAVRAGGILHIDEPNVIEPAILMRLDELLDNKRQLNMEDLNGEIIKAHPDLFIVFSMHGQEPILIRHGDAIVATTIGQFIDSFFKTSSHDYNHADVSGYEVLAINKRGKVCWSPFTGVLRHRAKTFYRIVMETGAKIATSGNHSVFILTDQGAMPKKVDELRVGDKIVTFHGTDLIEEKELVIRIIDDTPKTSHRNLKRLPEYMILAEDFAKLLGYYVAEGSIDAGRHVEFAFATKDQDMISDLQRITSQLGFNSSIKLRDNGTESIVIVNSAALARYLTKVCGKGAKNKKVPTYLFTAPTRVYLNFLEAYIAGDGCELKGGGFKAVTVSKQLAWQLVWSMKLHNINPLLYQHEPKSNAKIKHTSQHFTIHVSASENPFTSELTEPAKTSTARRLPSQLFMNALEESKVKRSYDLAKTGQINFYLNKTISKKRGTLIVQYIKSQLSGISSHALEVAENLCCSDISGLKITDIQLEEFDGYLYDICGSENESFFVGRVPVLAHNTMNPPTYEGVKDLPEPVKSRLTRRYIMEYPPQNIELGILKFKMKLSDKEFKISSSGADTGSFARDINDVMKVINGLRTQPDLSYTPSLRETQAFVQSLKEGDGFFKAFDTSIKNLYFGEEADRIEEALNAVRRRS